MKVQIRRGVFETNSSSTHSITICTENEYNAWKYGELWFDRSDEKLVCLEDIITYDLKHEAEKYYQKNRKSYWKCFKDLSIEEKQNFYIEFAIETINFDNKYETYVQWNNRVYNTYEESYTTPQGEKLIIFGDYNVN